MREKLLPVFAVALLAFAGLTASFAGDDAVAGEAPAVDGVAEDAWWEYPYAPCNSLVVQTQGSQTWFACSENATIVLAGYEFRMIEKRTGTDVAMACPEGGGGKLLRHNYPVTCEFSGHSVMLVHEGAIMFWRSVSDPKEYMGFLLKISWVSDADIG